MQLYFKGITEIKIYNMTIDKNKDYFNFTICIDTFISKYTKTFTTKLSYFYQEISKLAELHYSNFTISSDDKTKHIQFYFQLNSKKILFITNMQGYKNRDEYKIEQQSIINLKNLLKKYI